MRDLVRGLRVRMFAIECFLRCEDGQDMVEYALVLGLVAMGSVAAIQGLAASIGAGLTNIGAKLTSFTS
jgi:pilus assembly protein Flp/PilA